jgi:hypothetical protein
LRRIHLTLLVIPVLFAWMKGKKEKGKSVDARRFVSRFTFLISQKSFTFHFSRFTQKTDCL